LFLTIKGEYNQIGSAGIPGARSGAAAFSLDGEMVLTGGGGYCAYGQSMYFISCYVFVYKYPGTCDDFWTYDISTDTWTWMSGTVTGSPGAHNSSAYGLIPAAAIGVANGKAYSFGGGSGEGEGADLWVLDTTSFTWSYIGGRINPCCIKAIINCTTNEFWPGSRYGATLWGKGNYLWLSGIGGIGATNGCMYIFILYLKLYFYNIIDLNKNSFYNYY
jgi:hypothetical protein